MSGTASINRRILTSLLFVLIGLSGWSIASARKMLLFVNNEGYLFYCLELQTTGQLVWTGQAVMTGNNNAYGFAVSPDQHYLWSGYSDSSSQGIEQYEVSPTGQISTTGLTVQLSVAPFDLCFTPNNQLLVVGGSIFRVNPDNSIQSTSNSYTGSFSFSPRGDINFTQTTYPPAFRIDKIDYTSAIISTLEVVTTSYQPQGFAVYRPAGDYIAYALFGGPLEVRHILSNGTLDPLQVWDYATGGGSYLDITPDGNHIYANGVSHLDWSSQSSLFVESTELNPVSNLYQIKVSPMVNFWL